MVKRQGGYVKVNKAEHFQKDKGKRGPTVITWSLVGLIAFVVIAWLVTSL